MKKLYAHEVIEIKIPANSTATKFAIPDQPNLRDMRLMGVENYYAEMIPASPLSQLPLNALAVANKIFLTLVDNDGFEFLKLAPVKNFITISDLGTTPLEWDSKSFVGQIINYPKSFITMSAPLGNTVDTVVMFSILYMDTKRIKATTYAKRK